MVEPQPVSRGDDAEARELLSDIPRRVRLPPEITPETAIHAVLCTLTQHARGAETQHLLDALSTRSPLVLERCARHREVETTSFGRETMLRRVAAHLDVSRGDAEDITAAVMMALGVRVRPEVVHELARKIPVELRELWVVHRVASPVAPHPIFDTIESEVGLPSGLTGMGAFTAVMSVVSRLFSHEDAVRLHADLPFDLRPLLAETRVGRAADAQLVGRAELFTRVAVFLGVKDAEPVVRAVFRAVQTYMRADGLARVTNQLPPDLQEVWLVP